MKIRVVPAVALLMAAAAVVAACGSSGSSASDATDTLSEAAGASGTSSTTTDEDGDNGDCREPAGNTIPDGQWAGPVTFDATGVASGASGSVLSTGNGTIVLEVTDGQVTGISGAFQATSTGAVEVDGATATIDAQGTLLDGFLTGTASAVHMEGTIELTGTMHITVSGVTVDSPLDGSFPMATDLTILSVSCDEVRATFIPALNASTGGRAQYFGEASWTGHPD